MNGIPLRVPYQPDVISAYIDLLSGDVGFNWSIWKKFLQVQNYFVGLFENKTDDEKFEKIESQFFRYLWTFGELFVTFYDDEIQLWSLTKKWSDGIIIKKCECQMITENFQIYQKNYTDKVIFTNGVQGIYVAWNPNVYPAIVWWWDYLARLLQLEKQFLNNTIWDSKKFIYTQNNVDDDITKLETDSLMDRDTPIVKVISPPSMQGKASLTSNIFTQLDFGNSQSDQAFDNLLNYQNYVWNMMGMMAQVNLKKERKTTSETQQDLYNTLNIENITLRQLKLFAKKAKDFGLNLEFDRVTDLKEETDKKELKESEIQHEGWK